MEPLDVFEVLVRENTSMLSAFIRSAVSRDVAVDDIWQETMLTAWRRWDDYDRSRPFGAWLRGIASNNILAWHRKHGKEPVWCDNASLEYISDTIERLQNLSGDTFDEKLNALRECITGLPVEYHAAIRLRYEEGLKPAAMAEQLSLKTETVKKQLQRAKSMLFDCISRKLTQAAPLS